MIDDIVEGKLPVFDIVLVREVGRYTAADFAAVVHNILRQSFQLFSVDAVPEVLSGIDVTGTTHSATTAIDTESIRHGYKAEMYLIC